MKTRLTLTVALALLATVSILSVSRLDSFARPRLTKNAINVAQVDAKPAAPTIKICKKTIPSGGTGFPFSWANGSGALPAFTLNDGQCETKNINGQDHYNEFTENVPSGWTLTNITCTHTTTHVNILGADANPAFQPGDNTVTMDLIEPNVTCTFTNQRQRQPPCCNWSLDLSTGQGTSTIDPLWKMNSGNAYIVSNLSNLTGVWMVLPPARWIQPSNSPSPDVAVPGPTPIYKYTVKFSIPNCTGCSHVRLIGNFAADNSATALLDGVPIPNASCAGPTCFSVNQAPVPLSGAPTLWSGTHTLEIDVTNRSTSYSGLIVNARLVRSCP